MADYETRFAFGSQQVYGPYAQLMPLIGADVLVLGMVAMIVTTRRSQTPAGENERYLALGSALVALIIVTNKVLSPQYMLWLLVMLALCSAASGRLRARESALLLGATGLSHVVFPYLYSELLNFELLPLIVLTARDALLIVLLATLIRGLRVDRRHG